MALFGLVFLVVALILVGVGIAIGLVACGLAVILLRDGSGWLVLFYGALGGAVSGVIVALLLSFIFRRLHTWASAKLTFGTRRAPAIREI